MTINGEMNRNVLHMTIIYIVNYTTVCKCDGYFDQSVELII